MCFCHQVFNFPRSRHRRRFLSPESGARSRHPQMALTYDEEGSTTIFGVFKLLSSFHTERGGHTSSSLHPDVDYKETRREIDMDGRNT